MDTLPLESEDTHPYSPESSQVVGCVYRSQKWRIGKLTKLDLADSSTLILRLEPIVELFSKSLRADNPADFGDTIVTKNDRPFPKSYSQNATSFAPMTNPERLVSDKIPEGVLIILFADGVAIISKRPCDILVIEEILARVSK